jgi:acyl-CoA synthetase (AMP-forming)/AMP-acid ligase II
LVEVKGDFLKVIGRMTDVVNVGGLKFLTSEVESVAVNYPGISDLSIFVKSNPITGQHIEMTICAREGEVFDKEGFKEFLSSKLPRHMMPQKILLGKMAINHRFKKK